MSIKETVEYDLATMRGQVSKDCDIKYARKLLNDMLKEETGYRGGWNCWLIDYGDEALELRKTHYVFKLTNAFYEANKIMGEYANAR